MGLLHHACREWLSVVGISLAGAFTHNLAQVLAAAALIGHPGVLAHLPYLLLFALPTGFFVGMVVLALGRAGFESNRSAKAGGVAAEPLPGESSS